MKRSPPKRAATPSDGRLRFVEAPAWDAVGAGWRQLFGSFQKLGFSFEWHDFSTETELDWARSFHPGGVELCLNLSGRAWLANGSDRVELRERTFAFYHQGSPPLRAGRTSGSPHQFITVEFAPDFLKTHFTGQQGHLHSLVRDAMAGAAVSAVSAAEPLTTAQLQAIETLRHPPVFAPAQAVWFQCKALELAAQLFFRPDGSEMFCTRQQRLARERVERAQGLLRENLVEPLTLEEIGRRVGCSPFYLSRLFSQETGQTMQQHLRQLRLERAAELLRTGRCNVTEAAVAVGYNSLSHFSAAFHEAYGCCPGLYPMRTTTQKGNEFKE